VRGKIVNAQVSFHFHDPPGQQFVSLPAHNQFAQQLRADFAGITIKKRARQQFRIAD
jgi:hypothetical protein